MQLNEFQKLYQLDPIQALEELFMQIVRQSDVDELKSKTVAEKLTLEELYHLHKNKPEQRLRYFLLRRS